MKTIQREIVTVVLLSKDGKLFLGKKDPTKGGVYTNCWHMPGGGVELRETKEQAAQREVLEEVGLDISTYPIEFVDDTGTGTAEKTLAETNERVLCEMHFNVYKVHIDKNANDIQVNLTSDLVEYQWISIEELDAIQLTPPAIEFFQRFDKNILKK